MRTSKKRSIYKSQNARIQAIFEKAQDPRKVLCVAIDYAKAKHVALICDGNGDILNGTDLRPVFEGNGHEKPGEKW